MEIEPKYISEGTVIEWENSIEGHIVGEVIEDVDPRWVEAAYYAHGKGQGLTTLKVTRKRFTVSADQSEAGTITRDMEARRK